MGSTAHGPTRSRQRPDSWVPLLLALMAGCLGYGPCYDSCSDAMHAKHLKYEAVGPCTYRWHGELPDRRGHVGIRIDGLSNPEYTADVSQRLVRLTRCLPDGGPPGELDILYIYAPY
jgi:hypothetical protein